MNIIFTTSLRNITCNHYLDQPKHVIECVLNKKIHENQNVLKTVGWHLPVASNYGHIVYDYK